jgi:uncharacterized membrane protein YhaH (DUF805 family)
MEGNQVPPPPTSARRTYREALRFSGRSTRTELLSYVLAALLISIPISVVTGLTLPFEQHQSIDTALALLIAIPVPALLVRRCHDSGRTGRWVWLAALGFIAWAARTAIAQFAGIETRIAVDRFIWPIDWLIVLANLTIIVIALLPGTAGPNRFGPDPRSR